jgi:hypothetical protein
MAKIYVGFSYPKCFKIGAYAIKKWQGMEYSHVYLRFESSNLKVPSSVYHAAHGMVHFREFEKFKNDNLVIKEYCLEVSEQDRLETLINCMYLGGEVYGYLELVKILVTDVAHSLGCTVKTCNSVGYICSELVGELLICRLKLTFNKPTYLLKPIDIDVKLQEYLKV